MKEKGSTVLFGEGARRAGLGLLWFYRNGLSRFKPACCRFYPTCSAYAHEAIARFGLIHGTWLACRRLSRCHPFYRGPLVDPVPDNTGARDGSNRMLTDEI